MAHALIAERLGRPVKGILLHPPGGLTLMNLETASGGRDALIYLAGPLINLTIIGILSPFSDSPALKMIANINRDIAIFKLLPIYPLDGGQLLAESLSMGAVTPSGVNRIIFCCSRVCCPGLGIYALNA